MPPISKSNEELNMFNKDDTKVQSYFDFTRQLTKLKESEDTAMTLGFAKYCYENNDELKFSDIEEIISIELNKYGLKPVRINDNIDIILHFKKKAEAIITVKGMKLDVCILKF